MEDISLKTAAVNRLVTVGLTQNQFDAVVSLVFNVGAGAFAGSDALDALNRGDFDTFVIEAFSRSKGFRKADGVVSDGLIKRRRIERLLFEGFIQTGN